MKVLSCVFLNDVLCKYRKSEKPMVLGRCFKCRHFSRFNHIMEEQEDAFWEQVDRIRGAEFCVVCACKLDDDSRSDVWNVCRRCRKTLEM